jgi:hypothetical protein
MRVNRIYRGIIIFMGYKMVSGCRQPSTAPTTAPFTPAPFPGRDDPHGAATNGSPLEGALYRRGTSTSSVQRPMDSESLKVALVLAPHPREDAPGNPASTASRGPVWCGVLPGGELI